MNETQKSANLFRLALRRLVILFGLGLVGALASATLVRFAPGYGVTARDLDPRLSANSAEALRQTQALLPAAIWENPIRSSAPFANSFARGFL